MEILYIDGVKNVKKDMKKIQKVINKAPEKKPKKYFYSRLLESSFLLYIWSRLAKIVKSLDILRRPMTEEKKIFQLF